MNFEDYYEDFFPDLTPFEYKLEVPIPGVLNIGWLHRKHKFTVGDINEKFQNKLKSFILNHDDGKVLINRLKAGVHMCPFCDKVDLILDADGKQTYLTWAILWIPSENNCFYASPAMLYHYIDEHNYKPPQEYVDAVMRLKDDCKFSGQKQYSELVGKYSE